MPGSKHFRTVQLVGTAVNEEFLSALSQLPELQEHCIVISGISNSRLIEFQKQNPHLTIPPIPLTPVTAVTSSLLLRHLAVDESPVEHLHGDAIMELPDPSVFAKAIDGDKAAIATVFDLASRYSSSSLPLHPTMSMICDADPELLFAALHHEKSETRRAVYAVLDERDDHAKLAETGLADNALQDLAFSSVLRFRLWQFGDRIAELAMDGDHRDQAAKTLCEFPPDEQFIPALIEALDSVSSDLRWTVARAMKYYSSDVRVVAALGKLLNDEETIVRAAAVKSLAASADPDAVLLIRNALEDSDSVVRKHARDSLTALRLRPIEGADSAPSP